jgi:hypothetical protein
MEMPSYSGGASSGYPGQSNSSPSQQATSAAQARAAEDRFATFGSEFKLEYTGSGVKGGHHGNFIGTDTPKPDSGSLLTIVSGDHNAIRFKIDHLGRWRVMGADSQQPLYLTVFGDSPSIGSLLMLSCLGQYPKLSHIGGEGPISIVAGLVTQTGGDESEETKFFIKCELQDGELGAGQCFATVGKGNSLEKRAHGFKRIDE